MMQRKKPRLRDWFARLVVVTGAALAPGLSAAAPAPRAWGDWPRWGDQSDGTYRNPVLPSDYSDLDCIRVGEDYYAISSTFQYSPGMVVLHSRDLVNWRICGHVVSDLTEISPELNWDRMNRYGRGIWAGAIRHHAGKFWVYFGTPDEGYFLSTATDPAGPWTPLHRVFGEAGWDDCCPFWDDDGQGWFVGTHFQDGYRTWLFPLSADGRELIRERAVLLNEGFRREANKLFKVGDTYYHFFSEHRPEAGRYVMMQRAKAVTGPYTEVRQLSHPQREAREPNQGGLVQTPAGEWFFLTHHGTGAWEGRAASLLPVSWVEGWPILGAVGADGLGSMVWAAPKPAGTAALPIATPQTDDAFDDPRLGPQWEWNYQPRAEKWSLTARPGFLRLHAWPPLWPGELRATGNILTQRVLRTAESVVTVVLELDGLAPGQVAGLCHFAREPSAIVVRHTGDAAASGAGAGGDGRGGHDERRLEFLLGKTFTPGPALAPTTRRLWLRSTWGLDGVSRYAFSEDGVTFTSCGEPYALTWGHYRGDRLGLFTWNDHGEAGYVDFDSFHYAYAGPARTSSPAVFP